MAANQKRRGGGLLLHISSLPSAYGIGDVGPGAYQFVDFLKKTGQKYWQILPLNPTNGMFGHSPYSSDSAFAANPLFISPDLLVKDGWLEKKDLPGPSAYDAGTYVDYQEAGALKNAVLDLAFQRFLGTGVQREDFEAFCRQNDFWLSGYSQFVAFKKYFQNASWSQWPEDVKKRQPAALQDLARRNEGLIQRVKFEQFIFRKQWEDLRGYCRQSGVKIIGDIPIYVNDDSADVWMHPEFFKLNPDLKPEFVAGIPPDYFSATGQRWGNPVYCWETLRQAGYRWWQERVQHNFQLFDLIRIDHFRGMVSFWQIPAHEQTAMNGQWVGVPWDDFLTVMKKQFGSLPIIAEDLGIITPEVTSAMKKFGFPGMKILLFAFDGETATHPYIPKNYSEDCVVYTGTHDNNTVRGWFEHEASHDAKERFFQYIGRRIGVEEAVWEMNRLAMTSVAELAIIPVQDILGLGQDARMNTPGTTHGNWRWRLSKDGLTQAVVEKLARLTRDSQR